MMLTVVVACILLAADRAGAASADREVTHIQPRYGGMGGGVTLTLYGVGFSQEKFSLDANVGNVVHLVSKDQKSFECLQHNAGSTENMITCITVSGMTHNEKYYVRVNVDGEEIPVENHCPSNEIWCSFTPHSYHTPSIKSFNDQAFSVGGVSNFLTLHGKLISDRVMSTTQAATNGITAGITRVYSGGNTCELLDENGQLYGVALESEDSHDGFMKCLLKGTFVGYTKLAFLLENPYGRSTTDGALDHISPDSKVYQILRYSEMTSVQPNSGGTLGSTKITIDGYSYETSGPSSTYEPLRIYVDDVPCTDIVVITDSYATCYTPAKPSTSKTEYPGGLGFNIEWWSTGTFGDNDAIRDTTTAPTGTKWMYQTKFCNDSTLSTAYSRMTMFFKAPHSGDYGFYFRATNGGELYVDGVSRARSTGGVYWSSKGRIELVKDTYYKIVAVTQSGTNSEACSEAMFRFYNTTMLSSKTSKVRSEKQIIRATSPITKDEQSLAFSGFSSTSTTAMYEVQKVCPSGATSGKIGFTGGPFSTKSVSFSNLADIKAALEALPGYVGVTFIIATNAESDLCFDVTIQSGRGSVPLITTNTQGVTMETTRTTTGIPDKSLFSLTFGGVQSSAKKYESDTAAQATKIQEMLQEVLSVRCPPAFTPSGCSSCQDFESGQSELGEKVVTDTHAFCGRHSYKNPTEVFPLPGSKANKLQLILNNWFCFAVKGLEDNYMYVDYETPSNRDRKNRKYEFTPIEVPESEGGWTYSCIDLLDRIISENSAETGTKFVLKRVQLKNKVDLTKDVYVDSLAFGKVPTVTSDITDLTGTRLGPGSPNPTMQIIMRDFNVEYNATEEKYQVTFEPHDCGSHFDLLTLGNSEVSTGTKASPSSSVTSNVIGGTGSMVTTRSVQASPALEGTVVLKMNNNQSDALNLQDPDEQIQQVIESSMKLGTVKVKSTTTSTCANRDIELEFKSLGGDQELASLLDVQLTAPAGAAATMIASLDGYLEDYPIMAPFLHTVNDNPQVTLILNGVPVKCKDGVDCSFLYTDAATPQITALSKSSGAIGETLVITGSLLSQDAQVDIGGAECTVTAGDSTSITCTLGSGTLGTHDVTVTVANGRAAGALTFSYTSDLSSISPVEGSFGGGNILTLDGSGFSSVSVVYVDDSVCTIVEPTTTVQIKCKVPTYSNLPSSQNREVTVRVAVGEANMATTKVYTYSTSLSATITSITHPATFSVSGGETISLTGTNFGSSPTVAIGGKLFQIDSSDTTSIVATSPVLSPGSDVEIEVDNGFGFALLTSSNKVPTTQVVMSLDNVEPLKGSIMGGTELTLTGLGFGTEKDAVEVFVGDKSCIVDSVSNTKVICETGGLGTTHYVDNNGTTGAGVYFAFNSTVLYASVGDTVVFTWTFPDFLNNVQFTVYEVDNGTTRVPNGGMKYDGSPSRNGRYEQLLSKAGTVFMNSGNNDAYGIKTSWIKIIVADAEPTSAPIHLTVNGQSATHNTAGTSGGHTGCAKLDSDKTGCTPQTVTHADTTIHNFEYSRCRTPVVTSFTFPNASIDVRSAVGSTVLTIKGEGFSDSSACTNVVKIGTCDCTVTTVSTTEFTCVVDATCNYEIATYSPLKVSVRGRGRAALEMPLKMDGFIAYLPEVTTISPALGSTEGGTAVTISGSGLAGTTAVTFGDAEATIKETNSESIVVSTPKSANTKVDVNVYNRDFGGKCSAAKCQYTYSISSTPTISQISPDEIDGPTTLTLTGTRFGTSMSDVSASIGGEVCTIQSLTAETSLSLSCQAIPHGPHAIELNINGHGNASSSLTVSGVKTATAVSPATGSVHGGTMITVAGHGFNGITTVTSDGNAICTDVETTLTQVKCKTVAHAAGALQLQVVSNGGVYPTITYTYSLDKTPTISTLSPQSVALGDTLTVTGVGFGEDESSVSVQLGEHACGDVTLVSSTEVQCTVGVQTSGTYPVTALVGDGLSNDNIEVEYNIRASGIAPSSGPQNGNQLLTITGAGFNSIVTAKVCDKDCPAHAISESSFVCVTPASDTITTCAVTVKDGDSATEVAAGDYTYNADPIPEITSISPSNGGTGGGTSLTLTGTNLSGTSVSVSIDGSDCSVDAGSSSSTQIVCVTGPHTGTVSAPVEVVVDGSIAASEQFRYIDLWSFSSTWGGNPIPKEGDFVVIPEGVEIMLDTSTETLGFLLINGVLTFDDTVPLIELNAKIILVNGGKLQVGTEENPYNAASKAIITLHGNVKDSSLPIYGMKVLAVREGQLELHGARIQHTWALLAETANAGSNTLKFEVPLNDWKVGDEIVIATTGGKDSQGETERHTISAVSDDKLTLTLSEPLEYTHISVVYSCQLDDSTMSRDMKAEVGLLSRNVIVRGSNNKQWNDIIEACPEGFDTGEFATQTCFEGRFGEEVGSDQFGGHIMVHTPEKDQNSGKASARIEYVDVHHAGQAFQLGRYPIHFHLLGISDTSYVKGCSISGTFNRAINIHATHEMTVTHNVIYDVMGGAIFLEDGMETGNFIMYNLLLFVKSSSSLLIHDKTAASFWILNPNNSVNHNHAAGGTHFGYWYALPENPTGPSYDPNYCPRKVPLGSFYNNSAHSFGWFGLWVFDDYYPTEEATCHGTTAKFAIFSELTSWHNGKGAEFVNVGALQLFKSVLVGNDIGFEMKLALNHQCGAPNLLQTCISGRMPESTTTVTTVGVKIPYGHCFEIEDIWMECINQLAMQFTEIQGTCSEGCGGFTSYYSKMNLGNTCGDLDLFEARWPHEGILQDKDGTMCDTNVPCTYMPNSGSHIPSSMLCSETCLRETTGLTMQAVSANTNFLRFSYNEIVPDSHEAKTMQFTNEHGSTDAAYMNKRLTHAHGWMVSLLDKYVYKVTVIDGQVSTNMSLKGCLDNLQSDSRIILGWPVLLEPDEVTVDGTTWYSQQDRFTLSTPDIPNGHWYYAEESDGNWVYVNFRGPQESNRKKRSGPGIAPGANSFCMNFQVKKCRYANCVPPLNPEEDEPLTQRPDDAVFWINQSIWAVVNGTWITNADGGAISLPTANKNVTISSDEGVNWVVINEFKPEAFDILRLYGTLEVDPSTNYGYEITANYIIIFGGRLIVGWVDNPLTGTALITLNGDADTPYFTEIQSAYDMSNKVIGVMGGLDLHGKNIGSSWTQLRETATAGTSTIKLDSGADLSGWSVNGFLVITTTSRNPAETEKKRILSIDKDAKTVTLTEPLSDTHFALTETIDGKQHKFAAAVGYLTRPVVVTGQAVTKWGAWILVSAGQMGDTIRSGFARISNTEVTNFGQYGYADAPGGYRAAVTFKSAPGSNIKPSTITNCTFYGLHNSAISLADSSNISVINNVIVEPVGHGIFDVSDNNTLSQNLVVNMLWTGSAYGASEDQNLKFEAGIWLIGATNTHVEGNWVVGSQRVGVRLSGESCSSETSRFKDNYVFSNLIGLAAFHADALSSIDSDCIRWSGFTTFNNYDFGILYLNEIQVKVTDMVVAQEKTGVFLFTYGPSAVDHQCSDKVAEVTDSKFLGAFSQHSCSSYTNPAGTYIDLSSKCRGLSAASGGRLTVVLPIFSQGPNNSPEKPCGNIMAYNALCGKTFLKGNTFKNIGPHATCGSSYALSDAPTNDDMNHEVDLTNTTAVDNVDQDYVVYISRPRVEKVNPSDCGDMDCDGKKKVLIVDLDGTFTQRSGAYQWIAEAEFEWDGDARRGVGDYRIPKPMLTDANGNRVMPNDIAPNGRGIIRSSECELITTADKSAHYVCPYSEYSYYEYLVTESMDHDNEERIIGPVAVLTGGFLDLINGPQDHGWCSGYACMKRLQTYFSMVKPGNDVQIYLTGTEPEKMRFFLVNGHPESCVVVALYVTQPNRYDIFKDDGDTFVQHANAEMKNGRYAWKDEPGVNYVPSCNDAVGSNYINRETNLIYFVVKGDNKIRIVKAKVVTLSMSLPDMSIDDFFGANIIENIASALGISLDRIRIVKIVSSSATRRKRSTTTLQVEFEIGDAPTESAPNAEAAAETSTGSTSETANQVSDICQVEGFDTVLGTQGAECNSITDELTTYTIAVPSELRFEAEPIAQHEAVPLATQPVIRAYDANGNAVPNLGIEGHAWEIRATLRSGSGHASAVLSGTTTITAVSGWFNFTDLAISHAGTGYILDFEITAPTAAAEKNFTIASSAFTIVGLPMVGGLNSMTAGYITQDSVFSMTLDLRDNTTNNRITDITWRGHTFSTTCGLVVELSSGNLTGTLTKTFDSTTGTAVFDDLMFSGIGFTTLACQIVSTPAEYDFIFYQDIIVLTVEQANLVTDDTKVIKYRYNIDFDATLPTKEAEKQLLMATIQKVLKNSPDIRPLAATISRGSILVTLTTEGSVVNTNEMLGQMCSDLSSGVEVTVGSVTLTLDGYMTVDGVDYYATCGTTKDDDDDGLHPAFIALIALCCVIVLAAVIFLLLWKFKVLPNAKTHGEPGGAATENRYAGGFYYIDNGRTVFLGGPSQRAEDIFYKQKGAAEMKAPPSSMAAPVTTLYDDIDMPNATTRQSSMPVTPEGLYKEWTMTKPDN